MSELIQIENINGQLVVDSRLVADKLNIKHKNFLAAIEKHKNETEQDFGTLAFETREFQTSQGNSATEKFYCLTEDQATYLMTLSKNTAEVRACKRQLVQSFSRAKELLKPQLQAQSLADMFLLCAQNFKEHEVRLAVVEQENILLRQQLAEQAEIIESVEMLADANSYELQRFKNGHGYWYSIVGYAAKHNLSGYSTNKAAALGRKATALCKQAGIAPEKVNDSRFGMVNIYPEHILAKII